MELIDRTGKNLSLSFDLLRSGGGKEMAAMLKTRIWGSQYSTLLARDMAIPFPAPQALIPITIRPVRPDDLSTLLDETEPGIPAVERKHRLARQRLVDAGFASCFVAVTADDEPCYIQWLMTPDENALLRREFQDQFRPLAAGEMLLEGAFTPEAFRGQRIMPAAMALLAEHAGTLGATRVVTYVGLPNIPSIKGCERAGFVPYMTRQADYHLGIRRIQFTAYSAAQPD